TSRMVPATKNPSKRRWEDERRRPKDCQRFVARESRIAWTTRASQVPPSWPLARVPLPKRQPAALPLPAEDQQPARRRELAAIAREHPNVSTKKVQARRDRSRGQRLPTIFVQVFCRPRLLNCGTVMSPGAAARAPAGDERGCRLRRGCSALAA